MRRADQLLEQVKDKNNPTSSATFDGTEPQIGILHEREPIF